MLFDRIVVVDWSASSTPKTGLDSIWIATAHLGGVELTNPSTRHAATAEIAALAEPGCRTLLGVDFSLGYPSGTADVLGMDGVPWRAMWSLLGSEITDDDRNVNNRFAVASRLNRRADASGVGPFWGCPAAQRTAHLSSTKPPRVEAWPPEWRRVEARLRTEGLRPFSAWQLLGAGAVGSQSLVGIAALERLRWNLGGRLRVWPFDTGFVAPLDLVDGGADDSVVVAEVWPSRWPVAVPPGTVKDAAQVEATARRFIDMDAAGTLASLFTPMIAPDGRNRALDEEGWVLGVT